MKSETRWVVRCNCRSVSTAAQLCLHALSIKLSITSGPSGCKELMSGVLFFSFFFFFSLLMEGSYSQTGLVNVCYCLRKAKWLLYISLRSHLNVLPTDEMKEGGKEKEERGENTVRDREKRKNGV